ncbi:uncharacterized protein LOC131165343 isoform X2 [Malania oleifera]|uniref:uncharacterized protein LOC131165343 isoform X2 n=1 Tax=Malania oleifera TaxID=397392 RepID=UPI0025AEB759|nr:uncharacterized protein LOC131165343 isoform X2 [Malania oleifera]
MSKHGLADSEKEENHENSSSDELEATTNGAEEKMTEYEKLRLSRIRENRARLEALGLPKMASSLMGLGQKESKSGRRGKGKGKMVEDEEYRPPEGNDGLSSSTDDDDDDEEFVGVEPSGSRARKMVKKKNSKPKKKVHIENVLGNSDFVDDDDKALMQAIALSLQDSTEVSDKSSPSQRPNARVVDKFLKERKGNAHIQEDAGRRKRKKPIRSRVQMTEDELIVHFFQFDEAGKGNITLRDLRRVAAAHDFIWTDEEMVDMIHCFDSDGDGKLALDDFRKIVSRCNMILGSENAVMPSES